MRATADAPGSAIAGDEALALASELLQLARAHGELPASIDELDERRLCAELAAVIRAWSAGEGRSARLFRLGAEGALLLGMAALPRLPLAAACRIAANAALAAVSGAGVRPALLLAAAGALLTEEEAAALLAAVGADTPSALHRLPASCLDSLVLALAHQPAARFGWRGALPGDRLILSQALGGGILLDAWRSGELASEAREALLGELTQPPTAGPVLACMEHVHAQSVASERGLLGALLELCSDAPASVGARIDLAALPVLHGAPEHLAASPALGSAARRNLDRDAASLRQDTDVLVAHQATPARELARLLVADPVPGGGLLVCCSPESVTEVLATLLELDFGHASLIGEVVAGERRVQLVAQRLAGEETEAGR
ncbi:AIR synthase-related protein [Rhodocyclus purpureus]|uniref:AIR synthase-related protein n=1 Tax=Rhodocyclus purpureus TaxID=1067 RepID=UPI0019143D8A|nr:AIR synthase-related protein [Rhodocyclus purpureus]MBK5915384.1 hypothetical protein [Rhodocyclus purpureus]